MIPIKKLKAKIVNDFHEQKEYLAGIVMVHAKSAKGHYLNLPWRPEGYGAIELRWNIRKEQFDRITFHAFGKDHRIKL